MTLEPIVSCWKACVRSRFSSLKHYLKRQPFLHSALFNQGSGSLAMLLCFVKHKNETNKNNKKSQNTKSKLPDSKSHYFPKTKFATNHILPCDFFYACPVVLALLLFELFIPQIFVLVTNSLRTGVLFRTSVTPAMSGTGLCKW